MGLADIAPTQEMTDGPYQTVLEMLGSRLAQGQLSDNELQEASYNYSMQQNEGGDVILFGTP